MSVQAVAAKTVGTIAFVAGGPASLYYSWDHITLYEAEREVINNKDLKLNIQATNNTTPLTITTDPATLGSATWTCEFVKESDSATFTLDSTLVEKIKKHLPSDSNITDTQRNNKVALVKACSKHRDDKVKSPNVKGILKVKKQDASNPSIPAFVDYPELNYLFKDLVKKP